MITPKVMVLGDTHGNWEILNAIMIDFSPDIILQCGDFGFWPNLRKFSLGTIRNGQTKIYFCDGNHDNHERLGSLKKNEVAPNIFYMKRGSTLILPDGRTVLFMGGADSIDKIQRTPNVDWFHEEVISYKDFHNLPGRDVNIDIIISHTCPQELVKDGSVIGEHIYLNSDPSRVALSRILEMYNPDLWFFAHWHRHDGGDLLNGTKWTLLKQTDDYFKGDRSSLMWLPNGKR